MKMQSMLGKKDQMAAVQHHKAWRLLSRVLDGMQGK
jgi:hypothetical protein